MRVSRAGGKNLSRWELDELLAKAALLLEAAATSDAINGGMTEPTVRLHANGEYTSDKSFQQTVIHPFVAAYHQEEFSRAADRYGELYEREPPGDRRPVNDIYSEATSTRSTLSLGLRQTRRSMDSES